MKNNITKELLYSHFAGSTSPVQKRMIDDWAKEIDNQEIYYQCLDEYEKVYPEYHANVDAAISRYYKHVNHETDTKETEAEIKKMSFIELVRRLNLNWAIAASIVLLLVVGSHRYQESLFYNTYATKNGEVRGFTLSDGSTVILNANSLLKVPRWNFGGWDRHVGLQGEAKFSVEHTPSNQKFVVETDNNFEVEVLGTEFTVYSRARGAKIVLNKGEVRLNVAVNGKKKVVPMKPGDLVQVDKENQTQLVHLTNPEIHSLWADHRFVFEKTTLLELSQILEDNYSLHTEVEDKELLKLTLSGTFTAKSESEMLDLISHVLDLHILRKKDHIFISKQNP